MSSGAHRVIGGVVRRELRTNGKIGAYRPDEGHYAGGVVRSRCRLPSHAGARGRRDGERRLTVALKGTPASTRSGFTTLIDSDGTACGRLSK